MNWIRTAVNQPVTVTVGMILIVLSGLIVLRDAPVQMTPTVDQTVITVTTRWENASPQEIETEVVDKQEEKLQGVMNLISLTSTSQLGQGQIRLEFGFGTNLDAALREVSDKLREVPSYPENVDEPVIDASDPESTDYIAWYGFRSTDEKFDIRTAYDFLNDRVKPRLERIQGVSEVNILGGREREVQVRFNPELLAQRGVTISQFVAAIRSNNINMSAGALPQGKSDIRIRTVGRFDSEDSVLNTVIRNDERGPVYVRDVATVVATYKEADGYVKTAGRPTMAMNFQKEPGANVIEVMEGIRAEVERLNAPDGLLATYAAAERMNGKITLTQLYDSTEYVFQAVDLVQSSIIIGAILSVIVLILFLRSLRSVGIIALAIPISVFGGLTLLISFGRSINVISLAGMAFAIGMVVDNSIVVLENIFRHLELGKKPYQAAIDGAKEVGSAVLASTLTTIVVFIPILLIQDQAGQLFADIAIAICASVGLSLLVSLTVIPSAGRLLLRRQVPFEQKPAGDKLVATILMPITLITKPFAVIPKAVQSLLYWINGSWIARIAIAASFIAATVVGIQWLVPSLDYLPSGNRNIAFGMVITPPGYNLKKMEDIGERVQSTIQPFYENGTAMAEDPFARLTDEEREALRKEQEARLASVKLPQVPSNPYIPGSPMITPPTLKNYFLVNRGGMLFHGAISDDPMRAKQLVPLLQAATSQDKLPDTIAFAFQFPVFRLGGSSGSAIKIDISGADGDQVTSAAGAIFGTLMGTFPGTFPRPNPSNFTSPTPELQIFPNQLRMAEVGLTMDDVGMSIAANGDGVFAGEYDLNASLVDLKVISESAVGTDTIVGIENVPAATPYGTTVELSSVADFQFLSAPEQIRRVGRQRAVTLELTPPDGMPLQEAMQKIDGAVEGLRKVGAIPASIAVEKAGSAGKLNDIQNALMGDGSFAGIFAGSLFFALLVVYLLMAVLFQSWTYPLVIMVSVPLATLGGFIGLRIVHDMSVTDDLLPTQNLDVLTILGFVILAGVVVNNAILIVEQTLNILRGKSELNAEDTANMTIRKAIAVAVKTRVRPIFMSTLTSVGGMLPLVLAPGAGSELYRGLGAVIVGGLLVSTVFTLFLTPVLLSMLMDISALVRRFTGREDDGSGDNDKSEELAYFDEADEFETAPAAVGGAQ